MTKNHVAELAQKPDPVLRVVPQPSDINYNGHIFGGWILAQMDIAAGITAGRRARGPVATVAVDGMTFIKPILPGDIISVYTEIKKIGRTSIQILVDVVADRRGKETVAVTKGMFIFVALNENHRPRPVDKT